jgi:hypothetical protein
MLAEDLAHRSGELTAILSTSTPASLVQARRVLDVGVHQHVVVAHGGVPPNRSIARFGELVEVGSS